MESVGWNDKEAQVEGLMEAPSSHPPPRRLIKQGLIGARGRQVGRQGG